jgi:hypothetical protein
MHQKAPYLLFAAFLLFTGCSLEQKLAKSFALTRPVGQFLLLEPEFVFKSNLKTFEVEGYDDMDQVERDSILLEKSLFLKQVSDSVVIGEFVKGFTETFKVYGADIFTSKSVDTLMYNGGHPYILNMAQFSLEEYIHPFSSEQQVYDEVLVIDGFDVNAINYNIWIELGRLNSEKQNKVLFNSEYLADQVNGSLRQNLFTGKSFFDYTIDTIQQDNVVAFARKFGRETAQLVFDYIMNEYMMENLPDDYPYNPYYYHWDPERKILYSIDEEHRIMVLDHPEDK